MEKVSIVIPVHNSYNYLKKCLDSVINQTYKNFEILIIDDHSTDDSIKLVRSFKDKRIKIFSSNNYGISYARNKGIYEACGDYICFLDSDDYWDKNKLKKQVDFIKKNNYAFIYTKYMYVDELGNNKRVANVALKLNYNSAIKNTCIFTSTVMLNMKILNKEDIYMPYVKYGEDSACWWQILKKGYTAYSIQEVLVYYRLSKNSFSANKIKAIIGTWKIYKLQNMNLIKRFYCFNSYLYNAFRRRII
jgi:teichuronic acid biosynthesis glycosyltransferase TuaG